MKIAFTGRLDALDAEAREALLARRPAAGPAGLEPPAALDRPERPKADEDAPISNQASETTLQVRAILDRVRWDGDAALLEMARELDGVELESLEIPAARWQAALDGLDPEVKQALERAAANIERFHRAQLPPEAKAGVEIEIEPGVVLGRRAVPLAAAGVYAPGGRAAYPSSVLMGVVPARAAGVREVIVCSPPGPSGEPPAEVLAACVIAGASRLFAIGGAGAIGAMAFGTGSVPKVDAVVGPGNRWVTEAKRQVAGDVVIDSPAGPSEVLVLAQDAGAPERSEGGDQRRATLVALELVAQAEHDPDAAVAFVTDSPNFLAAVEAVLRAEVEHAPRRQIVESALAARGALLLAGSWSEALDFAEAWAAEHLVLFSDDPRKDLARMTTSGTVFLGEASAVAFGDYMTGANHVLPTAGLARALSGLGTLHFLRFFTYQELTAAGAGAMSAATALLAEAEGLPGHAAAARAREGARTRTDERQP